MEVMWAGFEDLQPWAKTAVELAVLAVLAWGLGLLARSLVLGVLRRSADSNAPWLNDDVLTKLAAAVPSVIIQLGAYWLQHLPPTPLLALSNLAAVFTIYHLMQAVVALLHALNESHQARSERNGQAPGRSITSYVQLGKLLTYIVGALLMAAALMNRSPLLLLSGLGAMSAVLMLVFKDTILSFVAGVQLASNDMLRVGDWIEMPKENADGAVLDIGLNTVKVQNWDKTITTIPTWKLMTESFKNWRGMFESGGRRIMRALNLDAATVAVLSHEQRSRLARQQPLLATFLQDPANAGATNMAAFVAYTKAYLEQHPGINKAAGMTLMVRLQEPTALGIPVQIYGFTAVTAWVQYEAIQGAVFDHLIGVLPQFGLALYQRSSDYSNRQMVDAMDAMDALSHEEGARGDNASPTPTTSGTA